MMNGAIDEGGGYEGDKDSAIVVREYVNYVEDIGAEVRCRFREVSYEVVEFNHTKHRKVYSKHHRMHQTLTGSGIVKSRVRACYEIFGD